MKKKNNALAATWRLEEKETYELKWQKKSVAAKAIPEVPVPETLASPHRLVAAEIAADREFKELCRSHGWGFQSRCQSKLDQRRLRISSALYEGIEKRGHRLDHPKDSYAPVWCAIDEEPIEFHIIEYVRPTKVPLTAAELRKPGNILEGRTTKIVRKPMGQLVLLARSEFDRKSQRWSDSAGRLEIQLGSIILKFEEMAERAASLRLKREESHRQVEEEMAREDEELARQQKEADDWERLRGFASDWSEAQRLRRFIDVIAKRIRALPDPEDHGQTWLRWARARVEELDPMGVNAETTLGKLLEGRGLRRWEGKRKRSAEWLP